MRPQQDKGNVRSIRYLPVFAMTCLIATAAMAESPATASVPAPSEWAWQKTTVPLALVVRGLWGEYFRVDEALDKAGFRQHNDFKDLSRYAVIVMVNTPVVRIPKGGLEQVRDFVSQGGGLVVLGGLNSYGNGEYDGSLLEELLPVTMKDSYIWHFSGADKGIRLTRAEQGDWPLTADFNAGPCAWYFHKLVPKGEARVQVRVGDQPAMVSGAYGKGRVVACALTINGNPEEGALPFWDWTGWPALLGQAVEWAGAGRPAGTIAARPATGAKPLTEQELADAETGLAALPKDFAARAMIRPNDRTARLLFDMAVPELDEQKCALHVVMPALLPYARPEWAARLKPLVDALNPDIETRKAALTLLGATRDPSAYGELAKAMKDKRLELSAMDGLGLLGRADAIAVLRSRFEAVLATARLPEGPDRWKPDELAEAALPATHAAVALYRLGEPEAVARLCDLGRTLHLYCRILWNASNRWPKDPQGIQIKEGILESARKLQNARDFMVSSAGPVPASQDDAFVNYAMTADDPVTVEWLATAMEMSIGRLPTADWQGLASARSGVLARMSKACSSAKE